MSKRHGKRKRKTSAITRHSRQIVVRLPHEVYAALANEAMDKTISHVVTHSLRKTLKCGE